MKALVFAIVVALLPGLAYSADWSYTTRTDKLTDVKSIFARAISDNGFKFGFPYHGPNKAYLLVRQRTPNDVDVLFMIDRGQLVCRDCTVQIRFNDDPPDDFYASQSTDSDPTIWFLSSAERFTERARQAKRIRVQFTAYHEGVNVADFRLSKTLVLPQAVKAPTIFDTAATEKADDPPVYLRCREIANPDVAAECARQVKGCESFVKTQDDRQSCIDLAADLVGKK